MEKLFEKENLESKILHLRKIERGEFPLTTKKNKEKHYCEYCGKEIIRKGKRFCSIECLGKYNQQNEYNKESLIETSKNVHSMMEMARLYNITDNALRKHLRKFNIYEECKLNFIDPRKKIAQYSLSGEFIKNWNSASEIKKILGINPDKVRNTCIGNQKQSGGFIWKYIE